MSSFCSLQKVKERRERRGSKGYLVDGRREWSQKNKANKSKVEEKYEKLDLTHHIIIHFNSGCRDVTKYFSCSHYYPTPLCLFFFMRLTTLIKPHYCIADAFSLLLLGYFFACFNLQPLSRDMFCEETKVLTRFWIASIIKDLNHN